MFIILEIQATAESAAITPAKQYTQQDDALQEFFSVCSYAVKSTVPTHTVIMLQADGKILAEKTFRH